MAAAPVAVVLSTGRCGTQWLTAGLQRLHPEIVVEHEPIGALYAPRRHFRRYRDPEAILAEAAVARHLDWVEALEVPYVETGWPLFAALPLLAERLGPRLRVVHLTRHPVPTALSHLAHNSYAGSDRIDDYTEMATLGPEDERVFHPEYAERWEQLTPYEKCLFWWTEVSLFGLEFPQRFPRVPWLRLASERMMAGEPDALGELVDFLGLEWDPGWVDHAARVVDRWHHHSGEDLNPGLVVEHPATVEAAARLGYDAGQIDVERLMARYHGRPDPGLLRPAPY